eukprot:Tbor_TRINITY_DN6073_c0_g1::TRINITY_DN6073_c0_g1_i3::g.11470::m.11470/K00106/XDH; xanthine dehydrogenase/oxidase
MSTSPSHLPRDYITFLLNKQEVSVSVTNPRMTLLEYLRGKNPPLKGAKLGCGEGGCGACTVMVTRKEDGQIRHRSVNACLALLCSVDGTHVTTIEGIGNAANPHPVQERLAMLHGTQCGFCSPGFAMSMYSVLQENPHPTEQEMEESVDGNLCRCTGYRPILDAAKTFSVCDRTECHKCPNKNTCLDMEDAASNHCGSDNGGNTSGIVVSTSQDKKKRPHGGEGWSVPFDPQGVHQPPELPSTMSDRAMERLKIVGEKTLHGGVTWFRPSSLTEMCEIMLEFPDTRITVGNTDIGVETKIQGRHYPTIMSSAAVPEMTQMTISDDRRSVSIGAGCSISYITERLLKILDGE